MIILVIKTKFGKWLSNNGYMKVWLGLQLWQQFIPPFAYKLGLCRSHLSISNRIHFITLDTYNRIYSWSETRTCALNAGKSPHRACQSTSLCSYTSQRMSEHILMFLHTRCSKVKDPDWWKCLWFTYLVLFNDKLNRLIHRLMDGSLPLPACIPDTDLGYFELSCPMYCFTLEGSKTFPSWHLRHNIYTTKINIMIFFNDLFLGKHASARINNNSKQAWAWITT